MSSIAVRRAHSAGAQDRRRLWEVDALRGVAIVMMVIYHFMWDVWYFRILPDVILYAGFWKYFQRTTASLFIFLVGVSLTLSYNLLKATGGVPSFQKYLMRGLRIIGWGIVISLGVELSGAGYVHFGVLHLIGLSIILAYPFLHFTWSNLFLWCVFFIAGYFIQPLRVDTVWLVWIGTVPQGYAPNDFFPLIPWFGVVLLGVFAGNLFYPQGIRRVALPDLSTLPPVQWLRYLGRHSLLIYLIHQPLLFALFTAYFALRG